MSDSDDTSADIYGAVAQLVAHSVVSRKVAGSSPVCSAKFNIKAVVIDGPLFQTLRGREV